MKKFAVKFMLIVAIVATMIFASACSFFDTGNKQIADISTYRDEDEGGTYIVIEYDGGYEDDKFFIPDAKRGEKGNGIANIEATPSSDGNTTKLTIYYDDPLKTPDEIILPTGTYISEIKREDDDLTGKTKLIIYFSNPAMDPITVTLNDGKDGIAGDRIKDFYVSDSEDNTEEVIVHVVYERYNEDTGSYETADDQFVMPRGVAGKGIADITVSPGTYTQNEKNFLLEIIYDDGTIQTVEVPRANFWYVGEGEPASSTGRLGDFYFDKKGYKLYCKETNDRWGEPIADFAGVKAQTHTLIFYTDDDSTTGTSTTLSVKHGESVKSSNLSLSVPQKNGKVFLGWWTEKQSEHTGNAAHFTDITVVTCDLNLYAWWRDETEEEKQAHKTEPEDTTGDTDETAGDDDTP